MDDIVSGVYRAYPGPQNAVMTPAPDGYTPFYISLYNRHGSRYQPNDKRYANTRQRLREAQERGTLTPFGETCLSEIEVLCDSCLGHGGLLTSVGVTQLAGIGQRMFKNYPEVFIQSIPGTDRQKRINAYASVVKRCGQSMGAFFAGLFSQMNEPFYERFPGQAFNVMAETDSANMKFIAYDTPEMRILSAKDAFWQADYQKFYVEHTLMSSRIIDNFFTDATGLDSLQFIDDLYWLVIGMQNVNVPGCKLDNVFMPDELLECYRCVNYRMYICNADAPMSNHIPALSASSLLKNIISCADGAISSDSVCATLRFGHDTNLLRLLTLMKVHGCTAQIEDPTEAWKHWQEADICPMGANLQMVFYRNAEGNILVKLLHNEQETLIDQHNLRPVYGPYYLWDDLRSFLTQQLGADTADTEFIEPVQ